MALFLMQIIAQPMVNFVFRAAKVLFFFNSANHFYLCIYKIRRFLLALKIIPCQASTSTSLFANQHVAIAISIQPDRLNCWIVS